MRVEIIIARDDRTWDTEIVSVPDEVTEETVNIPIGDGDEYETVTRQMDQTSSEWDSRIIAWCQEELARGEFYRNAVYFGIYNSEPEQEEEDART